MELLKKYRNFIVSGTAFLAFFFSFFKVMGLKAFNSISEKANVFQVAFGMKNSGYVIYGFSFGAFLFILLVLASIALPLVLHFTKVFEGKEKWVNVATCGVLLVATILFFLVPVMAVPASDSLKDLRVGLACNYIGASILLIATLFEGFMLLVEDFKVINL